MPSLYNYNNTVPTRPAARFQVKTKGSTAFHRNAPQPLPGASAPHVGNTSHGLWPNNLEDHGWGNHTAKYREISMPTTPFNNILKPDPSSQFTEPVGTPGFQSDDANAYPRTDFAKRVKQIIDYLASVQPNDDSLRTLRHLYSNLDSRLPSGLEIEKIEKIEEMIRALNPPVVPAVVPDVPAVEPVVSDVPAVEPVVSDDSDETKHDTVESSSSSESVNPVTPANKFTRQAILEGIATIKADRPPRVLQPMRDQLKKILFDLEKTSDVESDLDSESDVEPDVDVSDVSIEESKLPKEITLETYLKNPNIIDVVYDRYRQEQGTSSKKRFILNHNGSKEITTAYAAQTILAGKHTLNPRTFQLNKT
jgi:hypothetical protein